MIFVEMIYKNRVKWQTKKWGENEPNVKWFWYGNCPPVVRVKGILCNNNIMQVKCNNRAKFYYEDNQLLEEVYTTYEPTISQTQTVVLHKGIMKAIDYRTSSIKLTAVSRKDRVVLNKYGYLNQGGYLSDIR